MDNATIHKAKIIDDTITKAYTNGFSCSLLRITQSSPLPIIKNKPMYGR